MVRKSALICAFALFQTISGQFLGLNNLRPGLNGNGLAANILSGNSLLANTLASGGLSGASNLGLKGLGANGLNNFGSNALGNCGVASTGGGLPVQSASPVAPTGVSVVSENAYEGSLSAGGNLPLLGTVGVDGAMPTGGAGGVSYGCGDGSVGITNEAGSIATGIASPASFPPNVGTGLGGLSGLGVNGFNGLGRGFGGNCAH